MLLLSLLDLAISQAGRVIIYNKSPILPPMKVVNFFKRIGTIKHKYKVEFTIDALHMSGGITQQINVIVKRGSLRLETPPGKLRKGKLDLKKCKLVAEEITMFYDGDNHLYLPKQSEIRVVIHTDEGKKKLAGVIELDLASYLNNKLQFKRQQKQLKKGPEKLKSKLSYEIFMKFLRESNSETAGSMVSGFQGPKVNPKQKPLKEEVKRPKDVQNPEKVQVKLELDDTGSAWFQSKQEADGGKDNKQVSKPTIVHYDRQLEEEKGRDRLNEAHQQQEEEQKASFEMVVEEEPGYMTHVKIPSEMCQELPDIKVEHQDTQYQQQALRKLKKEADQLQKENEKLQLRAAQLKQRLSQSQKQRTSLAQQNLRDTKYDNVGKYEVQIQQLEGRIEESKKSRRQNHKSYQELQDKYMQLKNQLVQERKSESEGLQNIESQYKLDIKKAKEQLNAVKSNIDKLESERKQLMKQLHELRNALENKQQLKKKAEAMIGEIQYKIVKYKEMVGEAMNKASIEDQNLLTLLTEHFVCCSF